MATVNGVWGIDIGQCALKAMRCVRDGDSIKVDAFDYIEYPKILSQPDGADPQELIREALEQFLSRNEVKGYKIAMSVPGQAGLSRFFKPPPVDAKKIPDIVKYEARQQIPFELDDVIWDYQQMGGAEVDGIAIDAEVGLFAMKKDAVYRAIAPLQELGVELDIVQLAPLAIYNYVTYDRLDVGSMVFDPDNPPSSIVVLSMGTETTDLVITNGYRVWQRSIPIGGNQFTKQLTKDLKLTFAKAEHLKRNARQAEDPKALFQSMRPVFNDLVTEVQRSVNFFHSVDRKAKVEGVLILGNTIKLPGLQQYLSKNLGYDVVEFGRFRKLDSSLVSNTPAFKENLQGFAVSYGLCLQALGVATLRTNLIPRELLVERLIRAKKPWAVGTLAALMLAFTFNFFFYYNAWSKVHEERWVVAKGDVDRVKSTSDEHVDQDAGRKKKMALLLGIGSEVVGNTDRRILCLELITALNRGLPLTPDVEIGTIPDPEDVPFTQRQELFIDHIESRFFNDLADWYTDDVKRRRSEGMRILNGDSAESDEQDQADAPADAAGPKDAGWVIEFSGHHFFNKDPLKAGQQHVYETLVNFLENGTVSLPNPYDAGKMVNYTTKELGLSYVIIARDEIIDKSHRIKNPNAVNANTMGGAGGGFGFGGDSGAAGGAGDDDEAGSGAEITGAKVEEVADYAAPRYDFSVQVVWQEKPLSSRLDELNARLKEQAEAAARAAEEVANADDSAPAN
jgi:type IV pilus assembly protein PilM